MPLAELNRDRWPSSPKPASEPGGRWFFLLQTNDEFYFLDTLSAKKRWWTIEVWLSFVKNEDYHDQDQPNTTNTKWLFRFNTRKKEMATLEMYEYDKAGIVIKNASIGEKDIKWERIVPGTVAEELLKALIEYFKTN